MSDTNKNENIDIEKITELYNKRFKVQEKTLAVITKTVLSLNDDNKYDIKFLWNLAGFINIISYDIKVITRDLIIAQSNWQQQHYARQSCLLIYESINDLFELLGKDFKSGIAALGISETQIEIKQIRSDLNSFKDRYFIKLQNIRNMSIGHRDKDALKQLKSILQIDSNETINMTIEFERILRNLENFITQYFISFMYRIDNSKNDTQNSGSL
jgi:hypothetical protein